MKREFEFSEIKNVLLKITRGVSFDEVIDLLKEEKELDDISHPNKNYPHQRMFIIEIKHYAYVVPYVRKTNRSVFLKTIFPSRKFTKKYLKKYHEKE